MDEKIIDIPMFCVGHEDYYAVDIDLGTTPANEAYNHLPFTKMAGLDEVLMKQTSITAQVHLPGNRSVAVPLAAPTGSQGLTRKDIVDGIRKGLQHIYRQARVEGSLSRLDLATVAPLPLLLVTKTSLHQDDQWLHVATDQIPQALQQAGQPFPPF